MTTTARPVGAVWAELAGQQQVVDQLTTPDTIDRPTHAWLFTGPPGSGRSTAARAFAQTLECERENPAERGCGQCRACTTIAAGTHPDVKIMSTERVTYSIDEIRGLVSEAQDKPGVGRWRIFVIEDADRMTERATNVLLKAIEEPPPRTIWLLCAPSPADVLVTIRSRTRPVKLTIPSVDDVTRLLVERNGIDPQLARFCAQIAQSHVGIAHWLARNEQARERRESVVALPLTIRSASAAVASAEELVKVSKEEAEASAAERNEAELAALHRSLGLAAGETVPPKLRHHVRRLEEDQTARAKRSVNDALDRAMIDISGVYRDVLMLQQVPRLAQDAEAASEVLINPHLHDKLAPYAQNTTPAHTLECLDAVSEARQRLTMNVPPQLALEAMLLAFIPRSSGRHG